MVDPIRVFIAIQLPDHITASLVDLARQLGAPETGGLRLVNQKKIHLTLKFIGDLESSDVGEVSSVVKNQVKDQVPFSLKLGKLGAFPGLKNPRVLWVGVEGQTKSLQVMQQNIDIRLQKLGYPRDDHLYSPHLTVARLKGSMPLVEKRRVVNLFYRAATSISGLSFEVESVSIMRSTFLRTGYRYHCLALAALGRCDSPNRV